MDQSDFFRFAIKALERLQVPYMIVGSAASSIYGEPRMTQDLDVVIDPSPEQLEQLCDAFPAGDFYLSREAARGALSSRSQFNIIHPESGNKVDLMISPHHAMGRSQIERRRRVSLFPAFEAVAAAPEDVILSKMLYHQEGGSDKHLRDIAGMFKVSGDRIDREYIVRWVNELDLGSVWSAVLDRVGKGS